MMLPAIAVAGWLLAMPSPGLGGAEDVPGEAAVIAGGERVKPPLVSGAMAAAAESFLRLPLGAERFAWIEGRRYVFVLEHHYHPPGTVGAPNGWHKGVSMYELR